ncbi:sigma-54-dependent transcriptional regulator [Rubellimicrobium roseum]|uniref:Nif-specific regulatory protein n=1 Tax=Rubellimicrobium roseum TaxID=687525 RepID=A0A5C4N8Q6_9RHOB|nr:sigma-54 dependent transcriptional regulator [Rubellimicrobium roseum]TNC61819.1 sigma-54-dependent Fis family transcriptional regulator [Rubellimicrobium roseum]
MTPTPTVLFVDDDESMRHSTSQALELAGLACLPLSSAEEALAHARPGLNGAVVTDIRMPGMDGMMLLARLREVDPELPVVLVTGHAEVQLAVDAMRRGAYDFIEKPFAMQELVAVLRRALEHRALVLDNRRLRAVAGQQDDLEVRLPGRSAAAIDLRRRLRAISPSETDVLLIGPTGAGKEVAARAIHDLSPRAQRSFVVINCPALPAQMIESELFGHEAGAFPGAMRPRFGRFEHARGGTILLDEIGSMPIELQPRLLRVLQDRLITRLGSNEPIPLDVRFIATSKVDLAGLIATGEFREDLYWRLAVTHLRIPSLAERREDIPLLFLQLVREAAARHGRPDPVPPPELLADLAARPWPGNVRELRNTAERWVLELDWMSAEESGAMTGRLADRIAAFERSIIAAAIAANGGRLKPVYENLGVSRKTLYEKMQKHGIDRHLVADPDGSED